MAVVLDHQRLRARRGSLVAGVPAPLRSGAHVSTAQADLGLDRSEDPHPAGSRLLDLAGGRRTHSAASRPPAGTRPSSPLGETRPAQPTHPGTGPPRIPEHPPDDRTPSPRTQTHQTRTRTPTRLPQPPARTPLRRRENRQTRPNRHSPPTGHRLKIKLRG